MRFDVLEPPRTLAEAPCTPCFPCNTVHREGLVQSNHPERLQVRQGRLWGRMGETG